MAFKSVAGVMGNPLGTVNFNSGEELNNHINNNMPISDRNANAILYSFRSEPKTNEINSAIQFFLHGYTTGVCYFRCYSNGNWSAWKVIS